MIRRFDSTNLLCGTFTGLVHHLGYVNMSQCILVNLPDDEIDIKILLVHLPDNEIDIKILIQR